MFINQHILLRPAARCSLVAALILAGLAIATLAIPGLITQQYFESLRDVGVYSQTLLNAADTLRIIIAVDTLFILTYVSALIIGALAITTDHARPLVIPVGALVVLLGVLDTMENMDILRMLNTLEAGGAVTQGEIAARQAASLLKWNVGYLALFLFAFLIPYWDVTRGMLKLGLWIGLPVLGAVMNVSPTDGYGESLQLVRYLFLVVGFFLFARVYYEEARAKGVI